MRSILFMLPVLLCSVLSNAQVNLPQGSAQVNIPIFSYTDNQSRVATGVSLGYSSGHGLKVDEKASNIGTGWQLQAGGFISRMQAGQPDDQHARYDQENPSYNYPDGYLYNNNITGGCPIGMSHFPLFKEKDFVYKDHNNVLKDREQDRFFLSLNGRMVSFVIGRNKAVKQINDSRLRIRFAEEDMTPQRIRTTISSFTVTDENGVNYIFRDKSLTKTLQYKFIKYNEDGSSYTAEGYPDAGDQAVNILKGHPLDEEANPLIVSAWHLSEITDPANGRSITFSYFMDEIKLLNSCEVSLTKRPYLVIQGTLNGGIPVLQVKRQITLLKNNSIALAKRLVAIHCPGGPMVKFVYGAKRVDLDGDYVLSKIEIKEGATVLQQFELDQKYMIKNRIGLPETPIENHYSRLCLVSLKRVGYDNVAREPSYRFDYNLGTPDSEDDFIPAPNSLAQDRWGYYNGKNANLPLDMEQYTSFQDFTQAVDMANKRPKSNYAGNGLLKSIVYPAGGRLEYEYKQNQDHLSSLDGKITGGVTVSRTILYDGADETKKMIKEYVYSRADGNSSGWGFEEPVNEKHTRVVYKPSGKHWNPVEGCKYDWKYPGIEFPEMAAQPGTLQSMMKTLAEILKVGAYNRFINDAGSIINGTITKANLFAFAFNILQTTLLTCNDDYYNEDYLSQTYTSRDLKQAAALPLNFSRIVVRDASAGANNGYMVHEFSDRNHFPLLFANNEYPYPAVQRGVNWAYGLPVKTTVFDHSGRKVQETENSYEIISNQVSDTNFLSCKCDSRLRNAIREGDWRSNPYYVHGQTATAIDSITPAFYNVFTGRAELTQSRQRIYTTNGQFFETLTQYEYHPLNFQLKKTTTTNEKGETLEARMYYPEDYNLPGPVQKMKDQNIIGVPLASESWILKSNGYHLLSGTVTEFGEMPNGELKPLKSYALENAQPLPEAQIGAFNPNTLVRNPAFFKLQGEIKYKDNRLPVQTNARTRISSSIYDYNQRLVVATCTNAEEKDIAYTGFEADGRGNWLYDPINIQATESMTGRRCFLLSNSASITKTGLTPLRNYILTCWAKDGATVLLNGNPGQPIASANGWVLYKFEPYDFTQLTLSGFGPIDDLRLHPAGALMSTCTYDPGIGKTSESDANNRITYYDYDGLGRLVHVRDEKRNIIKTMEYHYKEQGP